VQILRSLGRTPIYTEYPNGTHFLISDQVITRVQNEVFSAAPGKIELLKSWIEQITSTLGDIASQLPKNGLGIHRT
jgi:hypothetical protein